MTKEEERLALQFELDKYMTGRFLPENCAAGVFAKDGNLNISVAGERPNLRNFWSGKWVSNWSVSLSSGEATVTGSIKV
jgi:capping protein (actin filament) muscle Z-line, alpha